jgi:hypothetical protein
MQLWLVNHKRQKDQNNVILGPSTETNVRCKMTKISLVLYEKDLTIGLSFM